jgi:methyltransferase (TIGR00027 family)
MSEAEPLVRDISDTARWAAFHRAIETERPDAVFRDPLARRLAGSRGEAMHNALEAGNRPDWPWVVRTYLYDQFIADQIAHGADMVVNVAAGLDARPYRMELPASLHWIEIDLPAIVDYKEDVLRDQTPRCVLERERLDLADEQARREVFERLGRRAQRVVILTEGLLIYLTAGQVAELARDLARPQSFRSWIIDLASPGLVAMLNRYLQQPLGQAGAQLQFGPEEGPLFFDPHGWKPADVRPLLQTAAKLNRLRFWMRLLALLPASNGRQGRRPWGGVCLLTRA